MRINIFCTVLGGGGTPLLAPWFRLWFGYPSHAVWNGLVWARPKLFRGTTWSVSVGAT